MLKKLLSKFCIAVFTCITGTLYAQDSPSLTLEGGKFLETLCRQQSFSATIGSNYENARYLWLKDDVFFHEGEEKKLLLTEPGTYEVIITKKEERIETNKIILERCMDQVIPEEPNSLTSAFITSSSPVICGSASSTTLQANPSATGHTYQWYFSSTYSGSFTIISGATAATYAATQIGYYKVLLNDGVTAPVLSNPFQVYNQAIGTISDMSGNAYPTINTTPNTPVQIKVSFAGGQAPYTFVLSNTENTSQTIVTNNNPYTHTISSDDNTNYYIFSVRSACNPTITGGNIGTIKVVVDPSTSFSFSTPPQTNVCAGETIDVPYTTTGTWTHKRNIQLELVDANNNYVPNSAQTGLFTNPLKYTLPQGLIQGNSYKLNAFVLVPYLGSWQRSSYSLTVTSTGCSPRATINVSPNNENCGQAYLYASPSNSGNTYKWYRNNTLIAGATSYSYTATQSGNYKVQIENSSTGYNSTSTSTFPITVIGGTPPVITSPNLVICGSNTSATLSSSITGSSSIYQWSYRANNNSSFSPLIGETSSTLTTSTLGYYKLFVSNTTCTLESNTIQVSENPQISLTNISGTTDPITVSSGNSANIRVNFSGEMPFFFTLSANDYSYSKSFYATTNPFNVTLTPQQSTYFSVNGSNSCGSVFGNGIAVKVTPEPSLTLPTPSITTVCAGGRIELPYSPSGNWGTKRNFGIEMEDGSGNSVPNSFSSSTTTSNTIFYDINSSVSPGTYKVRVIVYNPSMSNSVLSTYTITITESGSCPPLSAQISNYMSSECYGQSLNAYPAGSYNYVWYKDGVVTGNNSSYFYANSNGTYTVNVSNSSGYNSTSPGFVVSGIAFTNSSSTYSNTSYCDNTTKTLTISSVSGASYQWYFSPNALAYTPISGATTNSYTTNQEGSFLLVATKGGCEQRTYFECPLLVKFSNQTVCQGSAVEVPANNYSNWEVSLKLINASTFAEVADLGNSYMSNRFLVNIPESVPPGNYRFKVVSAMSSSPASSGVLTVSSGVSSAAPVLTATPNVISGPSSQTINLSASGCTGTVRWVGSDLTTTSNSFSFSLNQRGGEYKAYCLTSSGCKSASSSIRIYYDCGDLMEPNDNMEDATQITGDSYTSPALCFDYGLDQDWLMTIINGRKYYIRAKRYGSNGYTSASIPYKIVKSLNAGVLTLETQTVTPGLPLDTELFLYDADGNQLAYNDDGNGNGLSKIVYVLPNPCLTTSTLTSPLYDVHSNETSVVRAQQITGLNKIENTANASYQAGSSILLSPGFETKISSSGVFKAEISNCN
jgi:hypothetical protein